MKAVSVGRKRSQDLLPLFSPEQDLVISMVCSGQLTPSEHLKVYISVEPTQLLPLDGRGSVKTAVPGPNKPCFCFKYLNC